MIRATIARGDGSLPGDHYRCQRCGHEAKFSVTRGRPELCRDCWDLRRIDAQHACASTGLGTLQGAETASIKGHKAAPITSRGLTAKTLRES